MCVFCSSRYTNIQIALDSFVFLAHLSLELSGEQYSQQYDQQASFYDKIIM